MTRAQKSTHGNNNMNVAALRSSLITLQDPEDDQTLENLVILTVGEDEHTIPSSLTLSHSLLMITGNTAHPKKAMTELQQQPIFLASLCFAWTFQPVHK